MTLPAGLFVPFKPAGLFYVWAYAGFMQRLVSRLTMHGDIPWFLYMHWVVHRNGYLYLLLLCLAAC